jgi:hypothetical protein
MDNPSQLDRSSEKQQKRIIFGLVFLVLILIAGLIFSIWYLLQDGPRTELIKNIMIIILGAELLLIGVSSVVLIIQISKLANLLKNEIKPVLDAANETMNTVRGTAVFMSDQVVEPVIKMNSFGAGIKRILSIFTKD